MKFPIVLLPSDCDECDNYVPHFGTYINQTGEHFIMVICRSCHNIVATQPIHMFLKELNRQLQDDRERVTTGDEF